MVEEEKQSYGINIEPERESIDIEQLNYFPPVSKKYSPKIGLIGCGGITEQHLFAYKKMGLEVVALCDRDESKAKSRQTQFFPRASVFTNYQEMLNSIDVDVVDVATHPNNREKIIEDCLNAKKHVLSQKPFVLNIAEGLRLHELAKKNGVRLAVNQNGRWAPHWSYMYQALRAGLIGDLVSADFSVQWDHTWCRDTSFNEVHHLILFDFAIHWFDILCEFMGDRKPERVFASVRRIAHQEMKPPTIAHIVVDYSDAQATLSFNGHNTFSTNDVTILCGSKGTLKSNGPSLLEQKVTLTTKDGNGSPVLEGHWFENGFMGTMGELLCSIEEGREPRNSAINNIKTLELCFAAIASADSGFPVVPGSAKGITECN